MVKKKLSKSHSLFQKGILSKLHIEVIRTSVIVLVVLGLTWGIAKATENELESATNNFSVIGTVSSISDETISLMNARGSDTQTEELYNLSIKYLDRIETKDYTLLIISDINPGDTIIAQGLTDGNKFFIKRIISFNSTPLPTQDETATTTPESIATSTQDIATTTDQVQPEDSDNTQSDTDNSSIQDETATTTPESIATSTQDIATTTDEEISTSTEEIASSTTEVIIDTITDIIEDGLDTVSEVVDTIVDTVISQQEIEVPAESPPQE
ncbi:MAG: hypothetical protein RLZZ517_630 [Candidatus Parcubacteria bacterium]|jgi:hypothetical protein